MQYPPPPPRQAPQFPAQTMPQPASLTNSERPWYKKKRYQLGGGLFGFLAVLSGISGAASGGSGLKTPPEELAFSETTVKETAETSVETTQLPQADEAVTAPPTETTVEKDGAKPNTEQSPDTWETKVADIANSDSSKNEKFDQVELLTKEYPIDKQASIETVEYLTDEFVSGNYITQLLVDEEYALKNIFLSRALERYLDDSLAHPVDRFAFDFYQNSKYVYRGVDAPDSDAVKSNERQMKVALTELLLQQ